MTEISIYQTEDGAIEVRQAQMALLFGCERSVITKHLRNVFAEGELVSEAACAKFAHAASDGKTYKVEHYNLDVIISVGYRVKSQQGTRFRQWATRVLHEHLTRGYSLNRERLQTNARELEAALSFLILRGQ